MSMKLVQKACFSNARLADNVHNMDAAAHRLEAPLEHFKLPVAADESR
jgi:hypothetical protein